MRTIHRSCHRCPFPKPPPPPSGDSRDPPRAQANFRHPLRKKPLSLTQDINTSRTIVRGHMKLI